MKQLRLDLRSDTVTRPTKKMRQAIYDAEVGDDVLGEDPTINRLEKEGAARLGKEDSLFVPSGTFGNQLALLTHCDRGSEVVLSDECHIVQHEAGAAAVIAGVQLRTYKPTGGVPTWSDIAPYIREGDNIHCPDTSLIEVENALSNGDLIPLESLREIRSESRRHGIPIHLDGARIFNAASSLGVAASDLADCADSVMFCLSKGLCAPVGSLLAGSRDFIQKARRGRKIMGGGMRQAGILAAAGLVAMEEMIDRLPEDTEKAALLAAAFTRTGLLEVAPDEVKINMFFLRFQPGPYTGLETELVVRLREAGILVYQPFNGWIRFVTHHDVSREEIQEAAERIAPLVKRLTAERR
jgi:threonine aldolase